VHFDWTRAGFDSRRLMPQSHINPLNWLKQVEVGCSVLTISD
jgi:hypothetical protein